jgi:hypothetical protein
MSSTDVSNAFAMTAVNTRDMPTAQTKTLARWVTDSYLSIALTMTDPISVVAPLSSTA